MSEPFREYTREQAIELGIPIHPEAISVRIYGRIEPDDSDPKANER